MSQARDNILQRIRLANKPQEDANARISLNQRMQQHPRGPQPQWQEDRLTRFTDKAKKSSASISQLDTEQSIVDAVLDYMHEKSLDHKLLRTSTPLLGKLNWPDDVTVELRSAGVDDKVALVEAFCAIAETGSIVMCSARETPVSLNYLPDHFLCVVHASAIVDTLEDVWEKIRSQNGSMPRAVNIITGPSRTADVEQIIQMGAHGPRRVHLLLKK